jgi:type IV secretion system protein VirB9
MTLLLASAAAMPAMGAPSTAGVSAANSAARVQPARDQYLNAIQRFSYAEGALYQVYTMVGRVTDIALKPGEKLVGPGPVAAGDTARWIIGDTVSGSGPTQRVHVLVKPTSSTLATNLIINTDQRTYHIELRANAATYMASVSWRYPEDDLLAIRKVPTPPSPVAAAAAFDPANLNFAYRIEGKAPWRPLRAFDDGERLYIEFPPSIAQHQMPPLFALTESGELELVNYRVRDRIIIAERLLDRAELRLGSRKSDRVRIEKLEQ